MGRARRRVAALGPEDPFGGGWVGHLLRTSGHLCIALPVGRVLGRAVEGKATVALEVLVP